MLRWKIAYPLIAVLLLAGCAHPIAMSPDIAKIEASPKAQPISKNVGYYISTADRESEVITDGGGGDRVSYHPYREIETGFYKMLDNVFDNVTVMKNAADAEMIEKRSIRYVVIPTITTTSHSSSLLTWPPTEFSVQLTCDIRDRDNNSVTTKTVTGQGQAEFSEFKSDFSLSARRASQDALLKMQDELLNAPELRK